MHTHNGNAHERPVYDEPFWDARYGEKHRIWSGNPNPQLVAEATDLQPGTALDVGCGEGADALWLADRGWRVTAVDISSVALERASEHESQTAPAPGAHRAPVTWMHRDLTAWTPPAQSFDLVTAQYMHLPAEDRDPIYRRLADAVAVGGTLLIVGHSASDLDTHARRPTHHDLYFTAENIVELLGSGWETLVAEDRPREASGPEGEKLAISDSVYRGRRVG